MEAILQILRSFSPSVSVTVSSSSDLLRCSSMRFPLVANRIIAGPVAEVETENRGKTAARRAHHGTYGGDGILHFSVDNRQDDGF